MHTRGKSYVGRRQNRTRSNGREAKGNARGPCGRRPGLTTGKEDVPEKKVDRRQQRLKVRAMEVLQVVHSHKWFLAVLLES